MSHSLLLQGSRAQLINQLVYFDDEIIHFLDQYAPGHDRERSRIEQLLALYSSTLEGVLSELSTEKLNSVALIGSELKVRYADDDSSETYTIVFPHQTDPNRNYISFLSPIGAQLLMAERERTYKLVVPSGELEVKVEDIKYMNRGHFKDEQVYR